MNDLIICNKYKMCSHQTCCHRKPHKHKGEQCEDGDCPVQTTSVKCDIDIKEQRKQKLEKIQKCIIEAI